MKYVIVYLIKGKAAEFQQNLVYKIAKKFDHPGTVRNKIPAHLTLKYSFETESLAYIKKLEKTIKNFTAKQKVSSLLLDGFGYFENPWVIYINAKESKEVRKKHNELIEELKKISWFPWNEFESKGLRFHSTLAHHNLSEEKFNKIWTYLKTQPKPYFQLKFDNITILKLADEIWKIYKEYKLNN